MRDEIVGLLDKADIAISATTGVIADLDLEPAVSAAANARVRLSYPAEMLVVALAGGTGSGKSSLANAICGTDAAEIGGVRPTTDEALALIPPRATLTLGGYLDALGVNRRKPQKVADWLCLIDLPDVDSVELENRLRVGELLPRLDVVVWVLDPEKYRDAALHHRYLTPLSRYADQFVFVLNQADRLRAEELDEVVRDLELALTEDGIDSGTVIVTAANPPTGPPIGVTDLVEHLERLSINRAGRYEKLLVDLEEAASGLLAATGGKGLGFEVRASRVREQSAGLVADGRPGEAVNLLKEMIESLAAEAGGLVEPRILEQVSTVAGHVQSAFDAVSAISGERKRKLIRWSEPTPEPIHEIRAEEAGRMLEESVIAPIREKLTDRAVAIATIADLALSVGDAKARARR